MKIMLFSGGSGGHLVPAMALAEQLESEDRCFFVSTRRPVDQILSADGSRSVKWETVGLQPFAPLRRWFSPWYLACQIQAVGKIRSMIRGARPDVVVGFGGYLSAVGVMAARGAGIPTVIHEQNVLPGRANRLLAWVADAVAVSFPETRRHLPKGMKVEETGNPMRIRAGSATAARARAELGFEPKRPVLLVMGGSQGSRTINRLVLGMWEQIPATRRQELQVLHLAGPQEAGFVERAYRGLGGVKAVVVPFLHQMDLALAAATLAVSRAGATGIAEMAVMGVPSILIPYPHAGGHQRANARWMQQIGGAVVLEEGELSAVRLAKEVEGLLADPRRIEVMRDTLRGHADGTAAGRLAGLVRRVARKRKGK